MPGFLRSVTLIVCFACVQASGPYSELSVQKTFCNTFTGREWGDLYDMSAVDFTENCAFCANRETGCPTHDLFILARHELSDPLCCIVKSHCSCPPGSSQTSCTANAIENQIPLYNLFSKSAVTWVDTWQQFWVSRMSKLVLTASAFARVFAAAGHHYKVKDLLQARAKLEEALGPLKEFDSLKNVEGLSNLINLCERWLQGTEKVQWLLKTLSLVENLKDAYAQLEKMSLRDFTTFCEKSQRWRSVTTGRYISQTDVDMELGRRIIEEIGEEKKGELLDDLEDVADEFGAMDEDLKDVGWGVAKMAFMSVGTVDKLSMAVSGSRYIARSVKNFATKLSGLAAEVASCERAVAAVARFSSALNYLMAAIALEQIVQGIWEDAHSTCGCCTQASSALINIPAQRQKLALYVQNDTFQQVWPTLPWKALDAVDMSTNVTLAFKFENTLLAHQEQSTRSAISKAAALHPSDSASCLRTAFLTLVHWAVQEVHAEVAAWNNLCKNAWHVNNEMRRLDREYAKIQQLKNEGCFFNCDSINHHIHRLGEKMCRQLHRMHEEMRVIIAEHDRLGSRVESAKQFFAELIKMKRMLGDQAPPLPDGKVRMWNYPEGSEVRATCHTCRRIPSVGLYCFETVYHIRLVALKLGDQVFLSMMLLLSGMLVAGFSMGIAAAIRQRGHSSKPLEEEGYVHLET